MAMGIYFLVYVQFEDIKLEGYGCCSILKRAEKRSQGSGEGQSLSLWLWKVRTA